MVDGDTCPFRCFALCAKGALLWDGWGALLSHYSVPAHFWNVVVTATDHHHKLPLAYLREYPLVLHLQLLFQGGVKFPTGGKSGGAKGVPWRRKRACGRADESATRVCVGSHAG